MVFNKSKLSTIFPLSDTQHYGGKARNLARLKSHGVLIPQSWGIPYTVLTEELYKANVISSVASIYVKDIPAIKNFLSANGRNSSLYTAIFQEMVSLRHDNPDMKRLAIRSSHAHEDGHDESYSGLFSSYINITHTGSATNCVLKCWSESFDIGVVEYQKLTEQDSIIPCSVIIQEFIPSEKSGVLFIDNGIIHINANWGLAQSIVDGDTGFDEWTFDTNKENTYYKNTKALALLPSFSKVNPDAGSIVKHPFLPSEEFYAESSHNHENILSVKLSSATAEKPCLSPAELGELMTTCENAGKSLDILNSDVEWTFKGGKLYLLQIRPLTRSISSTHQNVSFHVEGGIGLVSGKACGFGYLVENDVQAHHFPAGSILIAKRLSGATIMAANKAVGCIISSKSPLSHSAIIAREIGIPVVGAIDIAKLTSGTYYTIDGNTGSISKSSPELEEQVGKDEKHGMTERLDISSKALYSILVNYRHSKLPDDLSRRLHRLFNLETIQNAPHHTDEATTILQLTATIRSLEEK